ncbi:hypothetical protein BVG19_g5502 [[Candida] boidinii]|nr:hypothetical protein BVG19_g5502 [[Candida] boidinii]OWB53289.1 hypothetical protein B5S27_g4882 [[Candida] boidinii]
MGSVLSDTESLNMRPNINCVPDELAGNMKQKIEPQTELKDNKVAQARQIEIELDVYLSRSPTLHNRNTTSAHNNNSTSDLREIGSENGLSFMDHDPVSYPEGGLEANLVVLGAFFGLLPGWGIANSLGIIQAYIAENQLADVSNSTISWVFSIYSFLMTSSTVLSGTYFDRNGARVPIFIGSILLVASVVIVASATKLYQFIIGFGILCGLGTGILMSPLIGVISHYFKKNRATAMGIATNGGSLGGVIFPLMLRKLYVDIGFTWAMRVLALICGVCLLIAFFLVKERNLESFYQKKLFVTKKETIKYYLLSSFDVWSLKKDLKFLCVSIGCVFAEVSLYSSVTYYSFICMKQGFSQNEAFLFVTITNAVSILGRTLTSVAADKWIGRFNSIMILLVSLAFCQLVIWLPFKSNVIAMYFYCCCYGFTYGSTLSLLPAVCGQISNTSEFGKRYSTMYGTVGVSLLCLMPATAAIVKDGDNEIRTDCFISFCALLCLLAFVFYGSARYLCIGLNLKMF